MRNSSAEPDSPRALRALDLVALSVPLGPLALGAMAKLAVGPKRASTSLNPVSTRPRRWSRGSR